MKIQLGGFWVALISPHGTYLMVSAENQRSMELSL